MLFEKQKICITKIPLQNLICFYSKYHKSLIMSEVFYIKKEFTIVQLAPISSTSCLSATSSLQQINQLMGTMPPPPQNPTECPYV